MIESEPVLRLKDVALGYPGRVVLREVSFELERGEIAAVLGPNGAGKTTLLRGILGLNPPLGGLIENLAGLQNAGPPGYVPQHDSLDPIFPFSAYEVVLMGAAAGGSLIAPVSRRIRKLAQESLELVGLPADVQQERFSQLSGGQKQRVLIARALALEPQLLVLDEPTAGVDPGAERVIGELLQRLSQEKGMTVVLVSHHIAFIRTFATSVIWVDRGRATKGTSADLLSSERIEGRFEMSN